MSAERLVALPGGEKVPALGQGTWKMGEERGRHAQEIAALRAGIELGMTLIDTAEMYGEGRTEELVGEAVSGQRDSLFLVSKAYPHNAGAKSLPLACERSLRRLGTDRIDLYLLHWRGGVPLAESVEAFETLKRDGKIRHWGVSNFDVGDLRELAAAGGQGCATNQILYNFARRGPEFELLPVMESGGIPVMAYSPVEQGWVPATGALATIAKTHAASVHQIALAWLLRRKHMMVIPKASRIEHVRQNHAALGIVLSAAELAAIDKAFPPPRGRAPLEML
ncbi:Aldo/keto reductase [Rhizobiales bacterium GAS191]|nr:Aldo/keto reductase [Rhizobiales bacterium GAS191]